MPRRKRPRQLCDNWNICLRDYTIPKAATAIEEISEKLLDRVNVQPKNLVAEVALEKLSDVVRKNGGFNEGCADGTR